MNTPHLRPPSLWSLAREGRGDNLPEPRALHLSEISRPAAHTPRGFPGLQAHDPGHHSDLQVYPSPRVLRLPASSVPLLVLEQATQATASEPVRTECPLCPECLSPDAARPGQLIRAPGESSSSSGPLWPRHLKSTLHPPSPHGFGPPSGLSSSVSTESSCAAFEAVPAPAVVANFCGGLRPAPGHQGRHLHPVVEPPVRWPDPGPRGSSTPLAES